MKIDHGPAYWADAIATNMINVRAAFKILPDGTKAPIGYHRMNCHMVFDVKMEDFRQKARIVAGGTYDQSPAYCLTRDRSLSPYAQIRT